MFDFSNLEEDEQKALRELTNYSHRAIAIVVGQIIENRLEALIRSKLRSDEAVAKNLFRSSGPLGSFSVKIDLAYMLELIEEPLFKDLKIVKNIRNKFAHDISVSGFEDQQIKAWLDNLVSSKVIEAYLGVLEEEPESFKHVFLVNLPRAKELMIFAGFFYPLMIADFEDRAHLDLPTSAT